MEVGRGGSIAWNRLDCVMVIITFKILVTFFCSCDMFVWVTRGSVLCFSHLGIPEDGHASSEALVRIVAGEGQAGESCIRMAVPFTYWPDRSHDHI